MFLITEGTELISAGMCKVGEQRFDPKTVKKLKLNKRNSIHADGAKAPLTNYPTIYELVCMRKNVGDIIAKAATLFIPKADTFGEGTCHPCRVSSAGHA